jgi:hypothetical protein
MVHETELVYASISNYVWALRTWMRFQRQLDPIYGIVEWSDFMGGVEVLTFVPAEPRKEVPGEWIRGAVAGADRAVFWEVQAVLLMLILLLLAPSRRWRSHIRVQASLTRLSTCKFAMSRL